MTQVQQSPEEQTAVALQWLADICPTGLKTARGTLSRTDVEKIGEFIDRNYGGIWSVDALNDAVEKLATVLTWFDHSQEARAHRGQPVKQRHLSDQALRDAGMKPNRLPSHTEDTKPISQRELLQKIAKNILRTMPEEIRNYNPFKAKAQAMVIQGRSGRIDAYQTQELLKIFASREPGAVNITSPDDPRIDWPETVRLRERFQNAIDNRRNMQTRPGRPIQ